MQRGVGHGRASSLELHLLRGPGGAAMGGERHPLRRHRRARREPVQPKAAHTLAPARILEHVNTPFVTY